MNITVIGTGAYSLALVIALSKNHKNKITIWSESQNKIDEYLKNNRIESMLSVDLPDDLTFTTNYEKAMTNADIVLIATACQYLNNVSEKIKPYFKKDVHIVIASKGIEQKSSLFAHEIVHQSIKTKNIAVISGPSFAIDLASNEPIGLTIASKSLETIKIFTHALKNSNVKLRSSNDMLGVEICGSIKNVIALASGIIVGLGYAESTRAFLITEAMHDIKNLIIKLGGNAKTIKSFAGIGDLLLTCTSVKSRNYCFGELIGRGVSKKEIDDYLMKNTVEGNYSLESIYLLIKRKKIEIPIIDTIYKIVIKNENPNILIELLMTKK